MDTSNRELFRIARKLCTGRVLSANSYMIITDRYTIKIGSGRLCHVPEDMNLYSRNIRVTKRLYVIDGAIRIQRNRAGERALLDYLFVPTAPPKSLLVVIAQVLPQPIAEEIEPHLSGLPLRFHLESHIKGKTRFIV